jgi:hypothetical protein
MVKTYAVNTFDAWLNSEGDDISESYVKYQDYAALEEKMLALLDHPVMKAHTDALREAQITGLAFIRVNANGHMQALPSDRVRISVIQAVEERTAAASHQECDHLWVVGPSCGPVPEYLECVKCRKQKPLGEGVCE